MLQRLLGVLSRFVLHERKALGAARLGVDVKVDGLDFAERFEDCL
jgi:hypothetical protein